MCRFVVRGALLALGCLLGVAALPAQPPGGPGQDPYPPTKLTLAPRPAPTPRLKLPLVTPAHQQRPGNAALSYYRANELRREAIGSDQRAVGELENKLYELSMQPPTDELKGLLKAYVQRFREVYRELEYASLRSQADWDFAERLGERGFGVLLPEVQTMRVFASMLHHRCRLHLMEKNTPAALEDVRQILTMAKHIGNSHTLIQSLVAMAIWNIGMGELERVLQQPDVPNLYWSLTALPPRLVSLRSAMEGELLGAEGSLPMWREVERGVMTPEAARKALESFSKATGELMQQGQPAGEGAVESLAIAGYVALRHPSARKSLLAMGYPAADVEAMPAAQAVILDGKLRFRSMHEELRIWMDLPFLEAQKGIEQVSKRVDEAVREGKGADIFGAGLIHMLMPAANKVNHAAGRTERKLAILRTLEAVRMYAHDHGGQLPESLEQVTNPPAPPDPFTGKPFVYVRETPTTCRLSGMPIDGQAPGPGNSIRYAITLAKE